MPLPFDPRLIEEPPGSLQLDGDPRELPISTGQTARLPIDITPGGNLVRLPTAGDMPRPARPSVNDLLEESVRRQFETAQNPAYRFFQRLGGQDPDAGSVNAALALEQSRGQGRVTEAQMMQQRGALTQSILGTIGKLRALNLSDEQLRPLADELATLARSIATDATERTILTPQTVLSIIKAPGAEQAYLDSMPWLTPAQRQVAGHAFRTRPIEDALKIAKDLADQRKAELAQTGLAKLRRVIPKAGGPWKLEAVVGVARAQAGLSNLEEAALFDAANSGALKPEAFTVANILPPTTVTEAEKAGAVKQAELNPKIVEGEAKREEELSEAKKRGELTPGVISREADRAGAIARAQEVGKRGAEPESSVDFREGRFFRVFKDPAKKPELIADVRTLSPQDTLNAGIRLREEARRQVFERFRGPLGSVELGETTPEELEAEIDRVQQDLLGQHGLGPAQKPPPASVEQRAVKKLEADIAGKRVTKASEAVKALVKAGVPETRALEIVRGLLKKR